MILFDRLLKKHLLVAIGLSVLLFLISLINRSIHIDDAWLGEQAYWLSEKGFVKSELLRGFAGYETRQYVYHKLFIGIGALFIKLFGFKLYALKSISLGFLIIFMITFVSFMRKSLVINEKIILVLIILVLIHPLVFEFSFVYRPEIMLMTIGFISYILLYYSIQDNCRKYAFFAGVVAALACITHLNGIAFAAAGFFCLLLSQRAALCFLYSIGGLIISSIYFIDLYAIKEIEAFIFQFKNDPALYDNDYTGVWHYIVNIIDEHKRFFRDPKTLFFSSLVLFLYISEYKSMKEHALLNTYTLLLILFFAAFAQSKTNKYMLVYMPFLYLIVGICLENMRQNKDTSKVKLATTLIIAFITVSLVSNIRFILKNDNSLAKHKKISQIYLTNTQKIVAPMPFIFEEIDKFNIQSVTLYKILKNHGNLHDNGSLAFFKTVEDFGNKAIIMNVNDFEHFDMTKPSIGEIRGNYLLVDILADLYIFKYVGDE